MVIHRVNGARRMITKNKKSKQAPPSRVRYEAANPTVSIRISQELKEELSEMKEMSGLSMADILKAGLDKLKADTEEAYDRGYMDGYGVAKEEFEVFAPCGECGRAHLPVTSEAMKSAVAERLIGWRAKNCR